MPRFYFPIVDGVRLDDLEGIELPSINAARKHADLIALHMPRTHTRHIVVVDENGAELHRLPVTMESSG